MKLLVSDQRSSGTGVGFAGGVDGYGGCASMRSERVGGSIGDWGREDVCGIDRGEIGGVSVCGDGGDVMKGRGRRIAEGGGGWLSGWGGRLRLVGFAFAGLVSVMFGSGVAHGDPRKFTFVYQSTTASKGEVEYEQWVTWKTDKGSDSGFDQIDIRHEIEFGITDDFQLAVYVADYRYKDGSSVANDGTQFRDVAFEGIYNLSNPVTDVVGSALYGEVKIGPELFSMEGKVIVEKYFGQLDVAYNATFEGEWEGQNYEQPKGEFEQAFGVSYEVVPALSLGAELTHTIEFPGYTTQGDDVVYFGPNVSWRKDRYFATVTPVWQVTDVDSAANFQVRMILGIEF